MTLMTSQSLPPSSASGVMIMSYRIDLAGMSSPQEKFSDFSLLSDMKLSYSRHLSAKLTQIYIYILLYICMALSS